MAKRYVTYKTDVGWNTYEVDIVGPITPDDENGPFEVTKTEADEIKVGASIVYNETGDDIVVIPAGN